MKLNFIEAFVLWVIFLCCVASGAHSFVNYAVPQTIAEQQAKMEPTLELFRAYGLADERGQK